MYSNYVREERGEEEEMKKQRKNMDYKWFWFHPSEHPILIHSEPVSNRK